ncbi:hypothetical protein soil367_10285 [Hydrocarboniclastica marina]|uniref:7-cyano-7-deazaguanine synthase n=2 Tax=Hydrocarboniclastica marina TaxID=2259620 RepID=A0A4P7XGY9_9ALTE|nr:hypothetical protein soil367_10285 [Hydrocarboniclastica marina]
MNILWTGGWDSTYRLLYLLSEGKCVRPHYIKDQARLSTYFELRAMESIRRATLDYPDILRGTLLPTEVSEKSDIASVPDIHAAYNEILKQFYVGEQYMWLADYCVGRGIDNMEIGVENNPIVLEAVESTGYPYSEIFGRFDFPILSVSKLTMQTWAREKSLLPLLERSWFCHTPTRDGHPCGVCHPCEVSIKGGMGYRLPLKARVRYYLRVLPRVKALLKQFPRFYHTLYSFKHHR